jgi:hypothetical protein
MEYRVFEEIFKKAGFTPRQVKRVQQRAYKEYEDMRGKRVATGGQKKMSYNFLIKYLFELDVEDLVKEMYNVCRASREQVSQLHTILEQG